VSTGPTEVTDGRIEIAPASSAPGAESSDQSFTEGQPYRLPSLQVGDIYDGTVIDTIYGSTDRYIVFSSQGRLLWSHVSPLDAKALEAVNLFDRYAAIANLALQGASSSSARDVIAKALVRAFEADSLHGARDAFEIVESFIRAKRPLRVFGSGVSFTVYLDQDGEVEWECEDLPKVLVPITIELDRLQFEAATVLRGAELEALRHMLGNELAGAFRAVVATEPTGEVFGASRDFIQRHIEASVGNRYIASSLVVAVVFGVVLLLAVAFPPTLITGDARMLAIASIAGLIGAYVSLLQRSSSLVIKHAAPPLQIAFQSIARMALGMLFGAIVVVAAKGNVAFGALTETPYALFLLAVAAGFSERLVPDLLSGLGNDPGAKRAPEQNSQRRNS
jgi:hypothetical protein